MTQGIFINGRRPKSKKEIKEVAATAPGDIWIENTSLFGGFDKPQRVSEMPDGTVTFVGPDPYTNRKFYGNIVKTGDKVTVK